MSSAALACDAGKAPEASPTPRNLVVAKYRIPRGTLIDPLAVELKPVSGPPDSLTSVESTLARVSRVDLSAGAVVAESELAPRQDFGIAATIPKNFRAFPISVDASSVEGIVPGAYVDVVLIVDSAGHQEARTMLQNVRVAALKDTVGQTGAEKANLTLVVTPEEVEELAVADSIGRLRFSIRSIYEGNTQIPMMIVRDYDVRGTLPPRPPSHLIHEIRARDY